MKVKQFPINRATMAVLVGAAAALLLLAGPALASEQPTGQYVGAETCAGCHEDVSNAFKSNLHFKADRWVDPFQGCESCHGPGAEHAGSMDKTKIRNPAKLKAKESTEICLGCHQKGNQVHWNNGTHAMRGLACTTCHSIHNGHKRFLKATDEKDVCFQCHKQIKTELYRSSHHPIREGKITCTDCHNPHGTLGPKLISATTINNKCFECHAEKRGPFLWEHRPVTEDCMNCHYPHGSNHEKLKRAKDPYLCQRCHSHSRHPGTMYAFDPRNSGTAYQRLGTRVIYRGCVNCHSNIHGSNHPSGARFTR